MTIIGIDPGLSGAVAILSSAFTALYPAPTITIQKKAGRKQRCDEIAMLRLLEDRQRDGAAPLAYIEEARAMPKQGISSTARFFEDWGLWRGILVGLGIPYIIVNARTWQKEMLRDVDKGDTKAASILVAKRLFPSVSLRPTENCRKDSDGMADALLIAEYGRRQQARS